MVADNCRLSCQLDTLVLLTNRSAKLIRKCCKSGNYGYHFSLCGSEIGCYFLQVYHLANKYKKSAVHHEQRTALFSANRAGFNIYSLNPLPFLCGCIGRRMFCLNFSNCSLNHSAMGFRSMARTNLVPSVGSFSTWKPALSVVNFRPCSSE